MADYPYLLKLTSVLSASGTGTMSQPVPNGENWEIVGLRFIATGAFNVYGIRNSNGVVYTNAAIANAIPSTVLQNGANANIDYTEFSIPLVIEGGQIFYLDVIDTSAAPNTVQFVLMVNRHTTG